MRRRFIRIALVFILAAGSLTGCAPLGPKSIRRDRVDYIQEITESWKQQMLLNIVKLRYLDPPTFIDVSSIINQYGMENQINVDSRWYWPMPGDSGRYAGVGGYSRYSDKPTISYTPLSGHKFTQSLLTPIPPTAVVRLIQSGWAIDMLFFLTVKTINGVKNSPQMNDFGKGNNDFNQLIKSLRTIQKAGVTDIRLEKINEKEAIVFVISDEANKDMYRSEREAIRSILKVTPDKNSYKVLFGALPQNDDEIALLTRSMLEIMMEMADMVHVPTEHISEKRVKASPTYPADERVLTHIYSGRDKPPDAFTAIPYQGYWFWIDNKDMNSKRNFALLMIFMSLTEYEQKENSPLFSIGG